MNEFGILSTAAAGMDAQRFALDVAARNVAAAEVSDPRHPFERLVPQFAAGPAPDEASADEPDDDAATNDGAAAGETAAGDVEVIRATGTRAERGVDVDAVTEMVAVLNAQRAYEANASVFDAGKRLAERTIDMGRL